LNLLTMAAGLALFGYVVATVKLMTSWRRQSIAVWFAAALIAHDLVTICALADRVLWARGRDRADPTTVSWQVAAAHCRDVCGSAGTDLVRAAIAGRRSGRVCRLTEDPRGTLPE
jgi:hypothetical protein